MYCRHFYDHDQDPGELSDENYEKQKSNVKDQKINLVRRNSLNKQFIYVHETIEKQVLTTAKKDYDDFDLPEGVIKLERQEKLINENGVNKKLVKLIKYMEDGAIHTEIFKEKI